MKINGDFFYYMGDRRHNYYEQKSWILGVVLFLQKSGSSLWSKY